MYIYSHISGHLVYFYLLAIVNCASIKMGIQVTYVSHFIVFGYIPRIGIIEAYGSSIFNFFRNFQTFMQCLHHFTFPPATHKVSNFPILPVLANFVVAVACFIIAILIDVKWYLTRDLVFVFLMN